MSDMLTTSELYAEKRMTRRQQAEARKRRELPYYLIGHRSIVYRRADVEKFFSERLIKAVGK